MIYVGTGNKTISRIFPWIFNSDLGFHLYDDLQGHFWVSSFLYATKYVSHGHENGGKYYVQISPWICMTFQGMYGYGWGQLPPLKNNYKKS